MRSRLAVLASASLLSLAAGCGDGVNRTAVTGTVTYKGQPVPSGLISFRPSPGHSGPAAATPIVDGKFEFNSENGPVQGKYDVMVRISEAGGGARLPIEKGKAPPKPTEDAPPVGGVWLIIDLEVTPGSMTAPIDLDPSLMGKDPRNPVG